MKNRVAVITGATKGIGKGLFIRLAEAGVNTATVYHEDEKAAEEFAEIAQKMNIRYHIEKFDVCDIVKLPIYINNIYEEFGRIDYLINNVGLNVYKTIHDCSLKEWEKAQDIILNVPFQLMKLVIPVMRRQKFGRIVNIGASSNDYLKGVAGVGPFGVHKAALTVLTKTLALEEIKYGITVNMVAPGSTEKAGTIPEGDRIPISNIPIGRRIEIEEVVESIMFFLADNVGGITGQFIGVNGGLST